MSLLSPLPIFSLFVGIGATGLLLRPYDLRIRVVALAALAGGLVFYGLIIQPLWGLVFRFASTPSRALEGMIAGEAEAISHFDPNGKGLVQLTIDGQLVRILAILELGSSAEEEVMPGDKLIVTSVDGRTNSCHVTRL